MKAEQVCNFLQNCCKIAVEKESEILEAELHMNNGETIKINVNSDWWDDDNDILRISEIESLETAYMVDCNQIAFISF